MLNIGRLAPDGEAYYLDTVASGVEDYYTGAGEAPGYWLTESAADLGLAGRVDAADLRSVLGARHPRTGEALPRTSRRRVPGFDLAFRAPKSVSLVWALGDDETAAVVRDAHDQAVQAALGYLERHAAWSRRGRNGIERVPVRGLVAAAFRHRTSRAGDPLLHTHVLVSNLGLCADGQWRTLDSPRLYTHAKTAGYLYQAALREHLTRRLGVEWTAVRNGTAEVAGVPPDVITAFSRRRTQILQQMAARGARSAKAAQAATLDTRQAKDRTAEPTALRDQWAARAEAFGFDAADVAALLGLHRYAEPDGAAIAEELAGPAGLTARASTFQRRDVVRAWCERLPDGADVTEILRQAEATLDSRAGLAVELLDPQTAVEAGEHAGHADEVVEALARRLDADSAQQLRRSSVLRQSIETVLRVGWSPDQVAAALLGRELDSAEASDAVLAWRAQRLASQHATPATVDRGTVIRRSDGRVIRGDAGERRYSTPELLALEQRLVGQAVARQSAGIAVVGDATVDEALQRRPSLAGEQADMVRRLCTSGAGVEVVVGKAGAGKTFALDAAREAWQACGSRVVGAALAARAAAELESGAGIDSYTIDALLADLDRAPPGAGLARGSVVVIDEAGMVGTRKLARLLDHAGTANAKVVLVGDHRQLPEIDAGGVFRGLRHRLDPIHLDTNRRQRHEWERAALDELRAGDPSAAVAAYAETGGLVLGDTAEEVRERLVDDWWAAYRAGPEAGVMIAARVSDVEDLNARARTRLDTAGALTGPALVAAEREYRRGDRIVTLNNDRRLGVLNGTRATVTTIDPVNRTVAAVTDDGREIRLPPEYLDAGYAAHAYAITGHKAQGLTTERGWVLGSDEIYREWGYVALSRGREANRLYVVAGAPALDSDDHCHALPNEGRDAVAALADALDRSKAQLLAVDQTATPPGTAPDSRVPPREALQRVLAAAPRDPARALAWLAEERDSAHEQLRAAERRGQQATGRLSRRSGRIRRHGRREVVEQARADERRAAADAERWRVRLADIEGRAAALETEADARHRWLQTHGEDLGDAQGLVTSDAAVIRQRAQAAEFRTPAYLLQAIGPRPVDPTERRSWRTAATAIEHYRAAHRVNDPTRALGDPPAQAQQRTTYELTRQAVCAVAVARDRVLTHHGQDEHQLAQDLG